jgi:hypothetical protein
MNFTPSFLLQPTVHRFNIFYGKCNAKSVTLVKKIIRSYKLHVSQLALTSPTSGCLSVGIVRSWTKDMGLLLLLLILLIY